MGTLAKKAQSPLPPALSPPDISEKTVEARTSQVRSTGQEGRRQRSRRREQPERRGRSPRCEGGSRSRRSGRRPKRAAVPKSLGAPATEAARRKKGRGRGTDARPQGRENGASKAGTGRAGQYRGAAGSSWAVPRLQGVRGQSPRGPSLDVEVGGRLVMLDFEVGCAVGSRDR